MDIKDTTLVVLSDLHSGSTKALFPNKLKQFKHGNHTPTPDQRDMWKHFESCAKQIREIRKRKRLIIIHDGDALEGSHHGSHQVVTHNPVEQIDIHVELMDYFMREVRFKDEDKLYYVSGTETHTNDYEEQCAADLGAEQTAQGNHVYNKLELTVNGFTMWNVHHGPGRGKGANVGNALRNFLKNTYFDCLADGIKPPDMIISGHVHEPLFGAYIAWKGEKYHITYGIISPAWQSKSRFAYRVAPVSLNKIGLVHFDILASGDILPPKFILMANEEEKVWV